MYLHYTKLQIQLSKQFLKQVFKQLKATLIKSSGDLNYLCRQLYV